MSGCDLPNLTQCDRCVLNLLRSHLMQANGDHFSCFLSSCHNLSIGFTDPNKKIREQGFNFKGIRIEDDCWLGSGVKVLDRVTIGRGSIIGAGAVVTKDIPPYSIAVGVPAKVIDSRDRSNNKRSHF
jgi:acetyltransferase-like isoleucine patch superfamily enzyme